MWAAAALCGTAASLVSCSGCDRGEMIEKPSVSGAYIGTIDEISPTKGIPTKAQMAIEGSKVVVQLEAHEEGHDFEIELNTDDEHFDHEAYSVWPTQFSLEKVAGEEFDKPLTLLKFPMHVGETWDWQGYVSADGDRLGATAHVATSQESVYIRSVPVTAIVSRVTLKIMAKKPIERRLKFYFAKGYGLFKREFGDNSVREPLPQ
jgi:hypothetical protein